jgi:hypothetical protein
MVTIGVTLRPAALLRHGEERALRRREFITLLSSSTIRDSPATSDRMRKDATYFPAQKW